LSYTNRLAIKLQIFIALEKFTLIEENIMELNEKIFKLFDFILYLLRALFFYNGKSRRQKICYSNPLL